MPNPPERFAYPLMVVAAVATIWYIFRRPSNQQLATVTNPNSVWGTIPPLEQVLTAPAQLAAVPDAIIHATAKPYSTAPGTDQQFTTPTYLTFNMPPIFASGSNLPSDNGMIYRHQGSGRSVNMTPGAKTGGCGCGGGCGGGTKSCESCESPCDTINARYPDGRGGCMTTRPNTSGIAKLADGLQNFLDMERGYAAILPTPIYPFA